MKGLHIVQLAVEEFETLIQGGGDDHQSVIGGPGLKQGLFLDQRLFAGSQGVLVKGLRQLIQGLLILVGSGGLEHPPESGPNVGFLSFSKRLAGLVTLTFIGDQMLAQFEQGVKVTLNQGDACKGGSQSILGGFPTINGGPSNISQAITNGLKSF